MTNTPISKAPISELGSLHQLLLNLGKELLSKMFDFPNR